METRTPRTLEALISERLAAIGAANIPPGARNLIESDLGTACAGLIQRRVTAPVVGRAVARALAQKTSDTDGGQLPLFKEDAA